MAFLFANLPALTIAAVYCAYEACLRARRRRQRVLRERVAFMLWVMAHEDEAA
jgi:hypothetical protein